VSYKEAQRHSEGNGKGYALFLYVIRRKTWHVHTSFILSFYDRLILRSDNLF
jgi:hypothetical protein